MSEKRSVEETKEEVEDSMGRLLQACLEEMRLELTGEADTSDRDGCKSLVATKKGKHYRCEHFREKRYCKDCGGSMICEHGKIRNKCRACSVVKLSNGSVIASGSFCEHGTRKGYCKECSANQICCHGKQKYCCKDCKGSQICCHGNQKGYCKDCKGKQLCEHLKNRRMCKQCRLLKPTVSFTPKNLTDVPSFVLDSSCPAMRIDRLVLSTVSRNLFGDE